MLGLKRLKKISSMPIWFRAYATNLDYIQRWNRIRKHQDILHKNRIRLARMNADSCGMHDDTDEYEPEYKPLPRTGSVRTCPECGRAMYYGYCKECLEDRLKNSSRRE